MRKYIVSPKQTNYTAKFTYLLQNYQVLQNGNVLRLQHPFFFQLANHSMTASLFSNPLSVLRLRTYE